MTTDTVTVVSPIFLSVGDTVYNRDARQRACISYFIKMDGGADGFITTGSIFGRVHEPVLFKTRDGRNSFVIIGEVVELRCGTRRDFAVVRLSRDVVSFKSCTNRITTATRVAHLSNIVRHEQVSLGAELFVFRDHMFYSCSVIDRDYAGPSVTGRAARGKIAVYSDGLPWTTHGRTGQLLLAKNSEFSFSIVGMLWGTPGSGLLFSVAQYADDRVAKSRMWWMFAPPLHDASPGTMEELLSHARRSPEAPEPLSSAPDDDNEAPDMPLLLRPFSLIASTIIEEI